MGMSLLDTRQAADLVGVSYRTITDWVTRGTLQPWAKVGRTPFYQAIDVLHAERVTRHGDPAQRRARKVAQNGA